MEFLPLFVPVVITVPICIFGCVLRRQAQRIQQIESEVAGLLSQAQQPPGFIGGVTFTPQPSAPPQVQYWPQQLQPLPQYPGPQYR